MSNVLHLFNKLQEFVTLHGMGSNIDVRGDFANLLTAIYEEGLRQLEKDEKINVGVTKPLYDTQLEIDRQTKGLEEFGYIITSDYNFTYRICVHVVNTKRIWEHHVALMHDGSREDAQRAVHEAAALIINAAWTHHHTYDAEAEDISLEERYKVREDLKHTLEEALGDGQNYTHLQTLLRMEFQSGYRAALAKIDKRDPNEPIDNIVKRLWETLTPNEQNLVSELVVRIRHETQVAMEKRGQEQAEISEDPLQPIILSKDELLLHNLFNSRALDWQGLLNASLGQAALRGLIEKNVIQISGSHNNPKISLTKAMVRGKK